MAIMVKKALDDALRKKLHNAQSGVRSVVYTVVEKVMVNLLRKDINEDTVEAYIQSYFDTNTAAEGFVTEVCDLLLIYGANCDVCKR